MPVEKKDLVPFIKEAVNKAKKRNFLESVDLTINFKGLDLKKPENRIEADLTLPHQTRRAPKICVIATGDLALGAKEAGVNQVLGREDLERFGANKKEARKLAAENDFFIAQADLMPLVGKFLGPAIAPKGKMPKPGTGIVAPGINIKPIVEKLGKIVRLNMKKDPIIHVKIGDREMSEEALAENAATVINFIEGKLERGKQNIKNMFIKTTMGEPVKIEL
ncbi:MAG: 50S ribosomal protein L1 [Candidatus Odinarchaeota archaeon]